MVDKLVLHASLGAQDGHRILRLSGPLVISTLFEFQEMVRSDKSTVLILDFSEVPYVDSAGLGSVLGAYVSRQKNAREMALAGVTDRVKTLFQLTKVDQFLKFYPSVSAAEHALSKPAQAQS